jgi:lipoprotein-anchoring transpeptidase ErfK/SrfK
VTKAGGTRPRALALIAALALLAGCGGGDSEPESPAAPEEPSGDSQTENEGSEPASDAAEGAGGAELYFTTGEQFRKVERPLRGPGSKIERAAEALVAGPTEREQRLEVEAQTQIPDGVEVEDVTVADGTATVELSSRFLAGIPGDERERTRADQQELDARVAQVTYTLTQFANVEETRVVSGGVGVEGAADRRDFAKPAREPGEEARPRAPRTSGTLQVQERLAELHYLPKRAVDGVSGYRTQQAVIAFQSWEGLQRDGVVGPITSAALASAKRPRPRGSGGGRRIEVFRDRGVALLVNDGRTRRAVHVSTGAPGYTTPAGTFSVFRKEKMSWSIPFQQWLPWASYFNQGIAFHEYASVPTYPASHGCVRVPAPEARFLYRFADIGLKVAVY